VPDAIGLCRDSESGDLDENVYNVKAENGNLQGSPLLGRTLTLVLCWHVALLPGAPE
jgi:hypothetical protein